MLVSYAQSMDGKIATRSGQSQWISGPETLTMAHQLRGESDTILVGIGTVLHDDPELSCRIPDCQSPVRIVLDGNLRLPETSRIVRTADRYETIVYGSPEAVRSKRASTLERLGLRVESLPRDGRRLSIRDLYSDLGNKGYRALFVEGGSAVITAFFRECLVHRLVVVIAPILVGDGIPAVADLGIESMANALQLETVRQSQMGDDFVWELSCNG